MSDRRKLVEKSHIGEISDAGDFCFDSEGHVVMACPKCAGAFFLPHVVESRRPLTLAPSVVGPNLAPNWTTQVLAPCLHHFFVRNGYAEEIV